MFQLDPNWFYSSLAQSAASIVGLLGAVLATRLQDQIRLAREQRLAVAVPLAKLHERLTDTRVPMKKYLEQAPSQLERLKAGIAKGESRWEGVQWYNFSDLAPSTSVEVSERMLGIEQERLSDVRVLVPLFDRALTTNTASGIYALEHDLTAATEGQLTPHLSGHVNHILIPTREAARALRILALRTKATDGRVLWVTLLTIGVTGVVAPMVFLTAYRPLHKGVLLLGFTAGLLVLLVFLWTQLNQLDQAGRFASVLPPDDPELAA